MATNPRLIELEAQLKNLFETASYSDEESWLDANREELRKLRIADAKSHPSAYTAPACTNCGGLNVVFDANVSFDPMSGQDVINSVFDNSDCLDCDSECSIEQRPVSERELENLQHDAGNVSAPSIQAQTLELLALATTALHDLYKGWPHQEIAAKSGVGLNNLLRELVAFQRGIGIDDEGNWNSDETNGIAVAGS